jgi:hypothetical protein
MFAETLENRRYCGLSNVEVIRPQPWQVEKENCEVMHLIEWDYQTS